MMRRRLARLALLLPLMRMRSKQPGGAPAIACALPVAPCTSGTVALHPFVRLQSVFISSGCPSASALALSPARATVKWGYASHRPLTLSRNESCKLKLTHYHHDSLRQRRCLLQLVCCRRCRRPHADIIAALPYACESTSHNRTP